MHIQLHNGAFGALFGVSVRLAKNLAVWLDMFNGHLRRWLQAQCYFLSLLNALCFCDHPIESLKFEHILGWVWVASYIYIFQSFVEL
jgi:hypothetical protein